MKFDIVVVLCAGNFITPKDYSDYITINDANVYLGAINRLNAAVKMEHNTVFYIVVGGSKEKVLAMKQYLINYSVKKPIKCLVSGPSTYGNMFALNKYIEENIKSATNIGILSNSYHFTRIYSFIYKLMSPYSHKNSNFIPICSELIEPNNSLMTETINMINFESNGIIDLKSDEYDNRVEYYEIIN